MTGSKWFKSFKNRSHKLHELLESGLWLQVLIALILGVDRILDMCRTTVNVTGDLTACVFFDRWLPKEEEKVSQ